MANPSNDEFVIGTPPADGDDDLPFAPGYRSSYSLLLLFYLTTIAAIVVAACRLALAAPEWTWQSFLIGYIVAAVWLVIIAAGIGYFLSRKLWGAGLGVLAGLICGLLTVLLIFVEPLHYLSAGLVLGGGSWALALIAIVANRLQHKDD